MELPGETVRASVVCSERAELYRAPGGGYAHDVVVPKRRPSQHDRNITNNLFFCKTRYDSCVTSGYRYCNADGDATSRLPVWRLRWPLVVF